MAQRPRVDPIDAYRALQRRVDDFEAAAVERGADLRCGAGCEACCHVELEVSTLEAEVVLEALCALDDEAFGRLAERAASEGDAENEACAGDAEDEWSERERATLVGADGDAGPETDVGSERVDAANEDAPERCVMLEDDGRCAVYASRPLVCRSQGLALAYPSDVVPVEAVRARAGDKALVWCPLNFTTRPPTGADVLDAGRLDEALAVLNRASVGTRDPLTRWALRDLVSAAARERTVR